jgi:hypothetical protein
MRTIWVLTLGLVALTAVQGCKQKEPEPIPGPKAGAATVPYVHTPGIAWFQGSFDEAFARTDPPQHCRGRQNLAAPRATELARPRKRANSAPPPAMCTGESCPQTLPPPRHRLV